MLHNDTAATYHIAPTPQSMQRGGSGVSNYKRQAKMIKANETMPKYMMKRARMCVRMVNGKSSDVWMRVCVSMSECVCWCWWHICYYFGGAAVRRRVRPSG